MPFLGQDWRCGEKWIKTEDGWERMKVLECILDHMNTELNKDKQTKRIKPLESDNDKEDDIGLNELKSNGVSASQLIITRQPYVYVIQDTPANRENILPKLTVSEILNGLDMVGAVTDIRRFNYVCKLVQLIINEKLEQLSGNAQRTLFMIVRCMLIQVIQTNENFNIMKKLLIDFKKKIQTCCYYYFHHIGSQKLGEKHLNRLTKWINLLCSHENKPKRIQQQYSDSSSNGFTFNYSGESEAATKTFETLPNDCKLEIIRRLNNGLDVVNVSKCNRSLHDVVSKELCIWKNLCLYHFQQEKINQLLKQKNGMSSSKQSTVEHDSTCDFNDLDWKTLYFRLKRRYGHKEVYADMIHKCGYCKCLFWKEIGHPCSFSRHHHELTMEPVTPKKLINILLS